MALLEVKRTASGSEGQGIGSLPSGKTCFVPGVFPGEVCLCELENETSKYAVCNAVEVIEASPDRTAPKMNALTTLMFGAVLILMVLSNLSSFKKVKNTKKA